MAQSKTAVSSVHYQWRYCSLALSHNTVSLVLFLYHIDVYAGRYIYKIFISVSTDQGPKSYRFWRWSGHISMSNFRPIPPICSPENVHKPQFSPVSLSKMSPKWGKSTDCEKNQISSEEHPNFRSFSPCLLLRMPGNPKFDMFHKVFWPVWL